MAAINPTDLKWSAPAHNTDGSEITEPLNYTLGVAGEDGEFTEALSFPGALNQDGTYQVAFADLALENGAHTIALRAFYLGQPDLHSDWSGSLDIILGMAAPNPPFGLAAE